MRLSLEIESREDLPRSDVLYPRGAFTVFGKDGYYALCGCMKKAVENYLRLRALAHPGEKALDQWNFPPTFIGQLMGQIEAHAVFNQASSTSVARIEDWLVHLPFEDDLCHRCNLKKPEAEFCPPSEGSSFRQAYGWYMDMKYFELGVVPRNHRYLTKMPSPVLLDLISFDYADLHEDIMMDERLEGHDPGLIMQWLKAHDDVWHDGAPRFWDPQYPVNFTDSLRRELERRRTAVRRYVEDAIRAEFKFAPLAGKWKSEQRLFELIRKMAPSVRIKRNHRAKTLEYLELDIYLPDLNLGIEYQGIQHYEPVRHWGGRRGLEKVQERDHRKQALCEEAQIELVYFHHFEELSPDLVYRKLHQHIPGLKKPRK